MPARCCSAQTLYGWDAAAHGTFLRLAHDLLQLVMQRDEHDCSVLTDYLPERDWDFPRLRLRAHHRFPTLSEWERFALLSAVTAVLLWPSAASRRPIDPLHRLWQVLTPPRRRALVTAARRWPQRLRKRSHSQRFQYACQRFEYNGWLFRARSTI